MKSRRYYVTKVKGAIDVTSCCGKDIQSMKPRGNHHRHLLMLQKSYKITCAALSNSADQSSIQTTMVGDERSSPTLPDAIHSDGEG